MKPIVLFLFLTTPTIAIVGQDTKQELYMPLEFKKAILKGTRKTDGTVPSKYWQNRSQYKIKAEINPFNKILKGNATIRYYNQSPDTLKELVFHAYNDYYKLGSIRNRVVSTDKDKSIITEGMIVKSIKVRDEQIDVNGKLITKGPTFYRIKLPKPISPSSSIDVYIEWETEVPGKGFSRAGASDSTSMLIAYWYPEIAVYDDIDGWDRTVYDGVTEFYHDYSDFEVEITTPDTFVVWASVQATNEKEVLPERIYSRLLQARKSENPIKVISDSDIGKVRLKTTTWKYRVVNFPDFTFALSDHYVWDACSYKDDHGEFFLNSVYNPLHKSFSAVIDNQTASLSIFHSRFPKYKFPFNHFTIFNGDAGMEFPGMAHDREITPELYELEMDEKVTDFQANISLSCHEMFHSYFPFLVGINEKKYGWMDEGFASFSHDFIDHPYEPENPYDMTGQAKLTLTPAMVPSYYNGANSANLYNVSAASYQALYYLLGKDVFLSCMREYIDRWKYKHPTPYDFMNTFNSKSGQDLNWFWKAWYFDWGYMDLGISEFSGGELVVKNEGGKPLTFKVIVSRKDGSEISEIVKPNVWRDSDVYKMRIDNYDQVISIRLKPPVGYRFDAIRSNDKWNIK